MAERGEIEALVHRLQACFNDRRFADAEELHAPDFVSHALGSTGFEAGEAAWRMLVGRHPQMRVTAVDVLVDGDRAAVRSVVTGVPGADGEQPTLFEIFRIHGGRFAEMWGATAGFGSAAAPEDVLAPRTRARRVLDAIDLTSGLPADLLADDVVVEMPTGVPDQPRRIAGRAAFLAFAAAGRENLPFRLHGQRLLAVHDTADEDVLVVEYELTGTATTSGRTSTASFVTVLRVRDGLVAGWREYQDTAAIARALS